ncbi:hypothetical protein EIP86_008802 [Pleurotus ostreatoroseus]|nr:hypothetical protein EIP86_008802 [Pleurotus ostreatoroseus]
MLPSSNIQRGNKKLDKVMELSNMYQDVIVPEFMDDIRTARDMAVAIRDEYEEARRRNVVCSYFRRVRIARHFDDAASRALSRTIHITNTAPRRPTQTGTRSNAPDVTIIEEEESIEEEDISSSIPSASVDPEISHQTKPDVDAHPGIGEYTIRCNTPAILIACLKVIAAATLQTLAMTAYTS